MALAHAYSRGRCIVCGAVEAIDRSTHCRGHSQPPAANPIDPTDPINPRHYTAHPSGVECITVTRHMNFNLGNAVKYLWRASSGLEPTAKVREDLMKATWYINDELSRCLTNSKITVEPATETATETAAKAALTTELPLF
jgi:Protein of unknwon function (DUF3310)